MYADEILDGMNLFTLQNILLIRQDLKHSNQLHLDLHYKIFY